VLGLAGDDRHRQVRPSRQLQVGRQRAGPVEDRPQLGVELDEARPGAGTEAGSKLWNCCAVSAVVPNRLCIVVV
jgi:hypothetical protein